MDGKADEMIVDEESNDGKVNIEEDIKLLKSYSKMVGRHAGNLDTFNENLIEKAKEIKKKNEYISNEDIVISCKKGYLEGLLEIEITNIRHIPLWINLIIDGLRGVIVNTLNFYLYTLINIIYNLKVKYVDYFHEIISVENEDKFIEECKRQRSRYSDKLNIFSKNLELRINYDNSSKIKSLIDEMNLRNQEISDDKSEAAKEAEANEIKKLSEILSNDLDSTDSTQTEKAQEKINALKKVLDKGRGDKIDKRAKELLFSLKKGVTTIHIIYIVIYIYIYIYIYLLLFCFYIYSQI